MAAVQPAVSCRKHPFPLGSADLPLTAEQRLPTTSQDVAAVQAALSRVDDRLPEMVGEVPHRACWSTHCKSSA